MMKRNVLRKVVSAVSIGALVAGFSVATAMPAAATPSLDPALEADVREFFDIFGVAETTQEALLDDLAAGERWDSFESSSAPVSTTQQWVDGVAWSVSTYEDGSVSAQYVGGENPLAGEGGVSTMGVNDCGYSLGKTGNFTNCNIYLWYGLIIMGFRANFTINSSGYDKITSVWGASWQIGGACSASLTALNIVKGTESSTGPATAIMTVNATMCGVAYSSSFNSQLLVGGNSADHSWW